MNIPKHLKKPNTLGRDACEDVSDFGVDPEDYETEEEYSEALDEARSSWRDTCEDGADAGVDPDDYDTEEEYRAGS